MSCIYQKQDCSELPFHKMKVIQTTKEQEHNVENLKIVLCEEFERKNVPTGT